MHNDCSSEMAVLLPRLLRFALVLGGSRRDAERLVEAACQEAGSEAVCDSADTRLDHRMFSLVYEMWTYRWQNGDPIPAWEPSPKVQKNGSDTPHHSQQTPIDHIRHKTAELTTTERAVLALVVIDGRSYSEAAAILSLEVHALATLLYSARMRLVETL